MGTRFATTGPEGPQFGADDAENLRTQFNALRADVAALAVAALGDGMLITGGLAIGSNKDDVATGLCAFQIAGMSYANAAITTGTGPGNDVIPQGTYGAVALDIGINGTEDAIEAADNATGYASAALAVAGLPAVAAGHTRMGWVTATKSDGAFTFGTTEFDAANVTAVFTDAPIISAAIVAAVTAADLTAN